MLVFGDRTKTRNGLGNGSTELRFVALQVIERAFTVVVLSTGH